MATKTDGETSAYTFRWKIESISHYWLKKRDGIESPTFVANALKNTKWWLQLNPISEADENFMSFYLFRDGDCSGPAVIKLNYQIAFLDKDGLILKEGDSLRRSFKKSDNWGIPKLLARDIVFVTEREAFLPEDTLTIQCTIWKKKDKRIKTTYLYGRTFFKANRNSFMWRVDKISTLKSGLRNKFKDRLIDVDLVQNTAIDFEKKFVINVNSFDSDLEYFSFHTSIVDSEGKREKCGTHKYFADELARGELTLRVFTKKLTENKRRYLQNDVLSLHCEYFIVTETSLNDSEITLSCLTNEVVANRNEHYVRKKKSQNLSVLEDLKSMFNGGIFSDTEVRTSTKTFPAHRNILSARSAVFRNVFSHHMKEANSGHLDIADLEEDTVHRMLLYIYTDSLEDLQLESASKLYIAGHKYEILSLKSKCSSFIKDNLRPTNVCYILVLADLHQDNDLKCFVKDYILDHDKKVFGSQEWKDFMCTHLKLAADIMH